MEDLSNIEKIWLDVTTVLEDSAKNKISCNILEEEVRVFVDAVTTISLRWAMARMQGYIKNVENVSEVSALLDVYNSTFLNAYLSNESVELTWEEANANIDLVTFYVNSLLPIILATQPELFVEYLLRLEKREGN